MDDEKLIECVRKYEFLYNLKHPKYMDSARKEAAWNEIAMYLQQSAAACKERWQNLRDAYRRALRKKKRRTKKDAKNTKPWTYEKEMAFVIPYFVTRKFQDSIEPKSEDDDSENCTDEQWGHSIDQYNAIDQCNSVVPYFMKRETQKPMEAEDEECESFENPLIEVRVDETDQSSINHSIHGVNMNMENCRGTKRKVVESEMMGSSLLARLLAERYKPDTPREHTELDAFFLTISDTVKKFPPYLQAQAKNKVFNIVSQMELEQLQPPPS